MSMSTSDQHPQQSNYPHSSYGTNMYQGSRTDLEYVGFWSRFGAEVIDHILLSIISLPILVAVYGESYLWSGEFGEVRGPIDALLTWVFPVVTTLLFWITK